MTDYDRDQELIARFAVQAKRRDAMNQLQAIAYAICFDGQVSDTEIEMLRSFLGAHAHLVSDWPLSSLWDLLNRILADGEVSVEERRILLRTLREYALTDLDAPQPDPTVVSAPQTIFDDDVDIIIPQRSFVITGVLELSKRAPFQQRLQAVGGLIHDRVRRDTDFLIVGVKGSQAWSTAKYGTKIDDAQQLKQAGSPIRVVREAFAIEALLAVEAGKG